MGVNYFRNKRCADKSLGSLSQDDIRLNYLIIEIELSNLSTTVERVFFARIYYSHFYNLNSIRKKMHDREIFDVDFLQI